MSSATAYELAGGSVVNVSSAAQQGTAGPSNQQIESWCVSLFGLAETFRTSSPPRIRLCIQCLQALFAFPLPIHVQALAHFHLGKVLHYYSNNSDVARMNLEQAYQLVQQLRGFEEIRLQIVSLLFEIYDEQKHKEAAKRIIVDNVELSKNFPFWHCRFLFQLTELAVAEQDVTSACQYLEAGANFCERAGNAVYAQSLFLLSKGMLMLLDRSRTAEARPILEKVGQLIQSVEANSPNGDSDGESSAGSGRSESLNAFFLVLQVCYLLMTGTVKTAKPCLKQLQLSVQRLTSLQDDAVPSASASSTTEQFHWLPKEYVTVLVYLVTVIHSSIAGQMEKVLKYSGKALAQIEKMRAWARKGRVGASALTVPGAGGSGPVDGGALGADAAAQQTLLTTLQALLLENSVQCRLVLGQPSVAIREVNLMCNLLSQQPLLFNSHESQIHALLGMYSIFMGAPDAAERHFNTSLRTTKDTDLWSLVNLNLAIVYLQSGHDQQFYALLERIRPERLQTGSHGLVASAHFVRGLQSFYQTRFQEAKRYLKDSLSISNEEDIMRCSAASLVLLSHIFLKYRNVQECSNMLKPALELANSIQDLNLQYWATSLLRDVYNFCGDPQKALDTLQIVEMYAQKIEKDKEKAKQMAEHALIQWTEGPLPPITFVMDGGHEGNANSSQNQGASSIG